MNTISKLIVNQENLTITTTSIEQSNKYLKHNTSICMQKTWVQSKGLIFDQGYLPDYEKSPSTYPNVNDEAILLKCCNNRDLADVGCGLVAVYNIGVLLNTPMDMRSIIYWFEQNDGFVLNGVFGLNPYAIKSFYDNIMVPYTLYTDLSELENAKTQNGKYIVCQWNDITNITKGAHFYAVEERNGQLIPYNAAYNYSASANNGNLYRYNNFASVISYRTDRTGGLICAYKIG